MKQKSVSILGHYGHDKIVELKHFGKGWGWRVLGQHNSLLIARKGICLKENVSVHERRDQVDGHFFILSIL